MRTILKQLEEINEHLKHQNLTNKTIFNHEEASDYTGLSKSYLYKLSSTRRIKHSKPLGKLNYYLKADLDEWLLSNPQLTAAEINENVKYNLN